MSADDVTTTVACAGTTLRAIVVESMLATHAGVFVFDTAKVKVQEVVAPVPTVIFPALSRPVRLEPLPQLLTDGVPFPRPMMSPELFVPML